MDSSAAGIGAAGEVWVDPFSWAGAAALLLGLAAGQALGAALGAGRGRAAGKRPRPGRIARAIALLSLAILSVAALLVFADKTALGLALSRGGALAPFCAAALCLGFLAGLHPLVLGLPLAALALLGLGGLRLGLEGWLPLRPGSGEAVEIARLLPFEVGPASFRGQLESPARGTASVTRELSLASASVCLGVQSLEFRGPLRLAGGLVRPGAASGAFPSALRFYRIAGLAAPGGPRLDFAAPPHARLLDAALPPPSIGLPGPDGEGVSRSGFLGLVLRRSLWSPAAALAAFEPAVYSLSVDGASAFVK
jgi:hypothetical protein